MIHLDKRILPYLLIFAVFAVFRGIPEILAGDVPVGWDSINYYAPWTVMFARHGVMNQIFLAAPPLVFVLTISLYSIAANIWLVMKILGPTLYGIIGVSVFFFSRFYLSWSVKKSSFCAVLLMVQPAAMRIAWDLFKNELAIALMFFLLPVINLAGKSSRKLTFLIAGLSLLVVLSHQYVALIYFFILLTMMLDRKKTAAFKKRLVAAHIPALAIFVIITGIYSQWTGPLISVQNEATQALQTVHYFDFPTFSLLHNYLANSSYSALFTQTLTLFFLLFALILPPAILGFWHDQFLTPFLASLAFLTFLPLASPSLAVSDSERWMWMIVYTLPFYAVRGISKLERRSTAILKQSGRSKLYSVAHQIYKRKLEIVYVLLLASFAISYEFGILNEFYEPVQGYIPSRFSEPIFSSNDMQEITANLEWLNGLYANNFTLTFLDHFENLSTRWQYTGQGNVFQENSVVTLNVPTDGGGSALTTDFGLDYFGSFEVRFKIDSISEESTPTPLLTVRRSDGHGGGSIYAGDSMAYWDAESMRSFNLASLDRDWHTIRLTYNNTATIIDMDGTQKLYLAEKGFFGKATLGSTAASKTKVGSLSFDYFSAYGYVKPCLITHFRELGLVRINVDERFEIVTYAQDFQGALNYALEGPYTQVFMMLPTSFKDRFPAVHEMQHYSVFNLGPSETLEGAVYVEPAVNKPQSGDSWIKVSDDFSWSGTVMKSSSSSPNYSMLFGPYIDKEYTGNSMLGKPYVATFRLKASSITESNIIGIDICYNEGKIFKAMTIKAPDFLKPDAWQDFQLTFIVPDALTRGLEFRVGNLNNGVTDAFFDRVSVRQGWDNSTVYAESAFNKIASGGSWIKAYDNTSTSGMVMKASNSCLNNSMLFGPYIENQWNGESMLRRKYVATFKLKVSSNYSSNNVFYIDVGYNAGYVLNSSLIRASDFASSDAWQDFQLVFTVPSSLTDGLEFRIKNLNQGITDVFVDWVFIQTR